MRSRAMQSFELLRASDASAAIAAASRSPAAQQGASVRFLAGGTTLVDLMKLGVETPDRVVDINRLGLDGIERQADGRLRIGATARNSDLAHGCTASVDLRDDGTARVASAIQDIGTGTYTIMAQMVAERLGIPVERVEVELGDTNLPAGPVSGGSMATASLVAPIHEAIAKAGE